MLPLTLVYDPFDDTCLCCLWHLCMLPLTSVYAAFDRSMLPLTPVFAPFDTYICCLLNLSVLPLTPVYATIETCLCSFWHLSMLPVKPLYAPFKTYQCCTYGLFSKILAHSWYCVSSAQPSVASFTVCTPHREIFEWPKERRCAGHVASTGAEEMCI
jgi:hypothetical protein